MTDDYKKDSEDAINFLKIMLAFFVALYFLWYINGGPDRWNKKFQNNSQKALESNSLITSGVLKIQE
jgi:hypothetical protein